jgi:hypothetical protein
VTFTFTYGPLSEELKLEIKKRNKVTRYRGADKSLVRPTFLSIVFSVQGTGGSPTGPDPENRVGDQDIGSPGRPVLLGCKCPVSRLIRGRAKDLTAPRYVTWAVRHSICTPKNGKFTRLALSRQLLRTYSY